MVFLKPPFDTVEDFASHVNFLVNNLLAQSRHVAIFNFLPFPIASTFRVDPNKIDL